MKLEIGSFRCEPVWVTGHHVSDWHIADRLANWLFDETSLTKRLKDHCGGDFRVRVTSQKWVRPLRSERVVLGIRDDEFALVRQVHLLCDAQPKVFARTVIPARTLTGNEKRLAALGSRPLGAYLFSGKGMARRSVEFARITAEQRCFAEATRDLLPKPGEIWGRRSLFIAGDKPLLVSEIFLPGILETA